MDKTLWGAQFLLEESSGIERQAILVRSLFIDCASVVFYETGVDSGIIRRDSIIMGLHEFANELSLPSTVQNLCNPTEDGSCPAVELYERAYYQEESGRISTSFYRIDNDEKDIRVLRARILGIARLAGAHTSAISEEHLINAAKKTMVSMGALKESVDA